jgi:transcriptional regulator with XRE-family HTH domain
VPVGGDYFLCGPQAYLSEITAVLKQDIRKQELGISQAELEKRTGIDRTFISDLERGIQGPGIRTLYRIAKGLDTPAWELVRLTAKSPLFTFPLGRDF